MKFGLDVTELTVLLVSCPTFYKAATPQFGIHRAIVASAVTVGEKPIGAIAQ